MLKKIAQAWCWLWTGHTTILRTARISNVGGGIYMHAWTECIECGHESQGWDYGEAHVSKSIDRQAISRQERQSIHDRAHSINAGSKGSRR